MQILAQWMLWGVIHQPSSKSHLCKNHGKPGRQGRSRASPTFAASCSGTGGLGLGHSRLEPRTGDKHLAQMALPHPSTA